MGTDKMEGETESTDQYKSKMKKIAEMKFQLIASVIRGFPGTDPLGEGWPEIWTDQPNSCFY